MSDKKVIDQDVLDLLYKSLESGVPVDDGVRFDGWLALNKTYSKIERIRRASDCLRHAYEIRPDSHVQLLLAERLMQLNQVEEAREWLQKWDGDDCDRALHGLLSARLLVRERDFNAVVKQAEALLASDFVDLRIRWKTLYVLGKAWDQLGEWDKAWAAIEQANRVHCQQMKRNRPKLVLDAQAYIEMIEQTRRFYANGIPDHEPCLQPEGEERPQALASIVGFPRSGTTMMEQVLDTHPDVAVAQEENCFDTVFDAYLRFEPDGKRGDLWDLSGEQCASLEQLYEARLKHVISKTQEGDRPMDGPCVDGLLVDKYPLRLVYLDLVRRFHSRTKLIVMLRDPRDVLVSCLFQSFSPNMAMYHFSDAMAAAKMYVAVMGFYLEVGRNLGLNILEVRYEDVVNDFTAQSQRICAFLDVPWCPQMQDFHRHAQTREIRTPSATQVIRPLYTNSVARWRPYAAHLQREFAMLEPFVEAFGYEPLGDVALRDEQVSKGRGTGAG